MSTRTNYAIAVGILLLAVFFRLWNLPDLPTGLHSDEITTIRLAEASRQGGITVFYNVQGEGHEALYPTILALSTAFTGVGTLGYRLVAALAGVITVALIYTLGVRLFGHLAGLLSMALFAVTFIGILLSRMVLPEAAVALYIVATMLALARALPVYRPEVVDEATNTSAFAALGILWGVGFYLHPISLMMTLASMIFIVYVIVTQRPLSRRQLSYIGFSILMMIIVAMPYLISTINLPDIAAGQRIFGNYQGILRSINHAITGLFIRGDANPTYNLPWRPMFDLVSSAIIIIGAGITLWNWREPRYALVIIMTVILAPAAILADDTPNFLALSILLPLLTLLFGVGARALILVAHGSLQRVVIIGLYALLVFNIGWTARDLFIVWPQDSAVQTTYNSDLGQLARHLDSTAHRIPSVLCYPDWQSRNQPQELSRAQIVLLMMNRRTALVRWIDCRQALLFPQGGELEQLVMPDLDIEQDMHPHLRNWLSMGQYLDDGRVPPETVMQFDLTSVLADSLGVYTTTSPASYDVEAGIPAEPIAPPVRFGGNMTWLGYDIRDEQVYKPGDIIPVITYWRVEGAVPSDLNIFTHILSDPITIAAQRDVISVNPRHLRERDILVQVTYVPLPEAMLPGDYAVSTGIYEESRDNRLPVFEGEQPRGDRLFLYPVRITRPEDMTASDTNN